MKTLKWGLVGCGDIAQKRVAPALRDLKTCELHAVARLHDELAEPFARTFGAETWYSDWHDLIQDPEIEAVYIATPVYLHAQQTIKAAQAGKHVLCEKPMALNSKDCDRMIEACESHHVKLGIAYYRRFYPIIQRIKEILASGEIGKPVMADAQAFRWFDKKPGEARYWLLKKDKSGGGPMMDFGCHRIEVLQNLFGTVYNTRSDLYNLQFDREVEDTAFVSMGFDNQIHGMIRVSDAVQGNRDTLDIYATQGTLRVPVLNQEILRVKSGSEERMERHPRHENAHLPLIHEFTQAVFENRDPAVTGTDGKQVSQILDEIYKQNT
ncbi:MAG: Gfo/Idh/MocA family oxidoreductase [candidate division KSB1 bacterium]|nr:Gfo/Idh/MocA family oxidoreductase [candidate division KSB1 bacterium]